MNEKIMYGIAWFKEEDWEEWKKISEDEMEDKYDSWLTEALIAKSEYEKEGYIVKQVTITPNNFKNWCMKNFKKLDSSSRSQYVAELLEKVHS